MLRLVLYALYLLGIAYICNASFSCNSADNIYYSCSRYVILAIDATPDMLTKDNIRAKTYGTTSTSIQLAMYHCQICIMKKIVEHMAERVEDMKIRKK
nr:unnamed protein product [Haemonchus contortus]